MHLLSTTRCTFLTRRKSPKIVRWKQDNFSVLSSITYWVNSQRVNWLIMFSFYSTLLRIYSGLVRSYLARVVKPHFCDWSNSISWDKLISRLHWCRGRAKPLLLFVLLRFCAAVDSHIPPIVPTCVSNCRISHSLLFSPKLHSVLY